jgi:7-cyano-7-deazaguanine synthase
VKIHAPLINQTKEQIIRGGTSLGIDFSMTISCYQADEAGLACGACDACRIRRAGFENADIVDSTRYKVGSI